MGITIVVNSVTTEDAAPTTAPHKVSHQTGKVNATIRWTPTNSTGHSIACYRIELGGSGPGAGTLLLRAGFPCSDTLVESRCSDTDPAAKCTDGAGLASGSAIDSTVSGNSLSGADGAYTVKVYAGSDDTALG